jgi:hypothetical protein
MRIRKNKTVLFSVLAISAALLFSVSAPVFADSSSSSGATAPQVKHHHHHHHMKKVFQACAKANGITFPAKGSGESLSSGDKSTLQACVKEFRQSVQTCAQNAGLSKPQPGVKPSAADKAAFKQCRTQALAGISG